MADKEKNTKIKADKTRILVLFVFLLILIAGIIFALFALKKTHEEQQYAGAQLSRAPKSIQSIPGVDSATEEYTKTQHQENLVKAQAAAERTKEQQSAAAIPTITRPAFVGDSSDFIAKQGGVRTGCSPEEIKRAKLAGVSASELRCKGCASKDIRAFFTAAELKQAGFSPADLKAAGLSIQELQEAAFPAKDLLAAGYTPEQLQEAGYGISDLKAAGVGLDTLSKLGATPDALRAAGYTADELLKAGYSVADLQKIGYSAKELKDAGASMQALSDAGFSPKELVEAGATDEELAKANVLPDTIKSLRAEFAKKSTLPTDCNIGALTKAKAEGVSAAALSKLKCDTASLKAAGYTAAQLKAAGFDVRALKAAGFDVNNLKTAGFNAADLKAAGFNAKDLKGAGFNPEEVRAAGLSAQELKDAGYSAADLKTAGFAPGELLQAGYTAGDLVKAGLSASDLRAAGYTPEQLKAGGVSPVDLKSAGFTDGELVRAGFLPEEINQSLLKSDPAKLREGGYKAAQLKTAGFSADKLRAAGYGTAELVAAGYSAEDLKKAGFSDEELQQAGISPEVLKRIQANAAAAAATAAGGTAQEGAQTTPKLAETQPLVAPENSAQNKLTLTAAPSASSQAYDGSDPEKVLERLQKRQAAQISSEQKAEVLQQIQTSMSTQATELFAAWNPPPTQQYVLGEKVEALEKGQRDGMGQVIGGGKSGEQEDQNVNANIVKAGSVMFAVLDTGINSDEVSPILATIVQGPLKGAKLLGQFNRTDQKVLLSFSTMSLKQTPKSITINAVAIDPDTARTAVASSVNNHYLLRYGTLFGSAFLSGFASGVAQSGATVVPQNNANAIITQPPLTTKDKIAMALGSVGTQYSIEMGKNFSVPPTVKVDPGTALGILFMADLAMPKEVSVSEEKFASID